MTARTLNSPSTATATNPSLIQTGWPLLTVPDGQGHLHYPNLADSIRELIEIILRTRPGEQLMRPNFGGGLENFLQQPNTLVTRRRIQAAITESLQQWETRILLHRVAVDEMLEAPTHIRVEIVYQIKRSGLAQQLGLTLELEG